MPLRDTATQPLHDIVSAFSLLTRLPTPTTNRHRPQAAWAWPLVGLVIGGIGAAVAGAAVYAGLPVSICAVLVIVASVLCTGALHEDGLADTFDGLFGGWTAERRLEIMKDSHIGSYGTIALILSSLIRWQAIAALIELGRYEVLIVTAMMSRAPMAAIMTALPNARSAGLSHRVGAPGIWSCAIAATFACGASVFYGGSNAIIVIGVVTVMAVATAWIAKKRIGGQTGDILGASQQITELSALCAWLALFS